MLGVAERKRHAATHLCCQAVMTSRRPNPNGFLLITRSSGDFADTTMLLSWVSRGAQSSVGEHIQIYQSGIIQPGRQAVSTLRVHPCLIRDLRSYKMQQSVVFPPPVTFDTRVKLLTSDLSLNAQAVHLQRYVGACFCLVLINPHCNISGCSCSLALKHHAAVQHTALCHPAASAAKAAQQAAGCKLCISQAAAPNSLERPAAFICSSRPSHPHDLHSDRQQASTAAAARKHGVSTCSIPCHCCKAPSSCSSREDPDLHQCYSADDGDVPSRDPGSLQYR